MKTGWIVLLGLFLVGNSWARIGDTEEQAAERYGEPRSSDTYNRGSVMVCRVYKKGDISINTTFFVDKAGKSVIGRIEYSLPTELRRETAVATAMLQKLLDSNADGGEWVKISSNELGEDNCKYKRQGATAFGNRTVLEITLDEYTALLEAESKQRASKQAERLKEQLKDF